MITTTNLGNGQFRVECETHAEQDAAADHIEAEGGSVDRERHPMTGAMFGRLVNGRGVHIVYWPPKTAQPLPIPTTPRHGTVNFFPRKPSSFATTDLTGADAATMELTIRRDFGRFIR